MRKKQNKKKSTNAEEMREAKHTKARENETIGNKTDCFLTTTSVINVTLMSFSEVWKKA